MHAAYPQSFTNSRAQSEDETSDDSDSDSSESEDESVPPDLLNKVRALVRAICASGQHQSVFVVIVNGRNTAGWWKNNKDEPIQIQPLKFLLDVREYFTLPDPT
jgi:hypothetical protein